MKESVFLGFDTRFIKLEFDAEPICRLGFLIASKNKVLRAISRFQAPPRTCRKCENRDIFAISFERGRAFKFGFVHSTSRIFRIAVSSRPWQSSACWKPNWSSKSNTRYLCNACDWALAVCCSIMQPGLCASNPLVAKLRQTTGTYPDRSKLGGSGVVSHCAISVQIKNRCKF